MGHFISKLDNFKIGFLSSYRSLRNDSLENEFESSKWYYIIVSTIAWLIFGAIALILNVLFGAISVNTFPAKCKAYSANKFGLNGHFNSSMINLWIITDILICLLTMPALTLNYYLDKRLEANQWLELMVHCQANALKKFYANDDVAKTQEKIDERTIVN
jgi:uncharacterized membrane protein